jgi:hypothetical protein
MKKFALILIIAVLSTFASAVVASDLGNKWWPYNPFRHFSGTYEMSFGQLHSFTKRVRLQLNQWLVRASGWRSLCRYYRVERHLGF